MKYPNLRKWKYTSNLEGLLFFAQVVEELLFDYTIDTYKVPAMNAYTLCAELCQTIDDVEAGVIKEGAIKPIIGELCDRLIKDHVAASLLAEIRGELIAYLNRRDNNVAEVKVRADLLRNQLAKKYLDENKRLLKETLVDAKQKERIISLTRTLVTGLIALGYSPEYIYFQTINFFFDGRYPAVIDSISLIDNYLRRFAAKELSLMVIYRVSDNFQELKDFAGAQGMRIQSERPPVKFKETSERVANFLSEDESLPLFLIMEDIKAYDVFAARENGDDRIQLLDSLARYHVHRQDFKWSKEALICSGDGRSLGVYARPLSPTLKRPEQDVRQLSNLMNKTLMTVASDKLEEESLSRFVRAFFRHDVAIKSEAPESQLLELWAAIEVLFPTYEGGEDKIIQIAKGIVPFVSTKLAAKLGVDLYSSIKNSGLKEALDIIDEVKEGSNEIEKCIALVAIKDNEDKRKKLYERLGDHVLLINRVFYLQKRLSSADMIHNTLIAHDRRVTWQIQRIYRARNLIIHSGSSLPYIKILVENLHSYLDRVLDLLMEHVNLSDHLVSIDQICAKMRLEHDAHIKLLEKVKSEDCTKDNFIKLLFGN
jgi:hypothetical protein